MSTRLEILFTLSGTAILILLLSMASNPTPTQGLTSADVTISSIQYDRATPISFIDTNGNGYYFHSGFLTWYDINIGQEYAITYFCDNENIRVIEDFKPTISSAFKCKNIGGVCK
jgi:hypothetical protein